VRRIATIAATLAVLSGCGGEAKKASPKPERAEAVDWQAKADDTCRRATDALVSRGWQFDLRALRRRLPGIVRDVRAGIAEIQHMNARVDLRFVHDMAALEPRFAELLRASKTLEVRPLDRAITRLEVKLRVLAGSARRAGLSECAQHGVPRRIVNVLRAPVASEQLALIFKATNPRLDAAEDNPSYLDGLRGFVAALADREASVRAMKVPRWAKRERAEYLAALHAYRVGLDEVGDRYAAGLDTPHAQFVQLAGRHVKRINRAIDKLWDGMGAGPTSRFP
jgi:hypothetical protein